MLGLQLLRLPSDAYVSHRGNAGSLTPHAAALSPDGCVKNQTCGGRRRSLPLLRRVETTGGRRKMLTSLSASFNASLNTPRHGRGQREKAQRTERRMERKAVGDICKMDVYKCPSSENESEKSSECSKMELLRLHRCTQPIGRGFSAGNGDWMDKLVQQF